MINQLLRGAWDRYMSPIGRALERSGMNPNAITLLGMLVQSVAAFLIVRGALLLAAAVAVLAAVFDVLDGAVAKARGTTRFGALLDSTTDRISDALFLAPIAWLYGVAPDTEAHDRPWVAAIALVALVASFLVSYIKARAEGLGYSIEGGIVERAERVILIVLGLLFDALLPLMLVILSVLSAVTIFQRLQQVRVQNRSVA